MVHQAIEIVSEVCDYFPRSKLEEIHCDPVVPEKPEFGLAQFELNFSGGMSCNIEMVIIREQCYYFPVTCFIPQ